MRMGISYCQLAAAILLAGMIFISACAPARQQAQRSTRTYDPSRVSEARLVRLTPTIGTNENVLDVQFVADYTKNPTFRDVANRRVLELINQHESLKNLLLLSVHVPPSVHAEDARRRAEALLKTWHDGGANNITNFLPAIFTRPRYEATTTPSRLSEASLNNARQTISNVFECPLETSIISFTKQFLTESYEAVTEDDYRRNFTVQGEVLAPLVSKIKTNYHHSDFENVDIAYSVIGGQSQLFVNTEPFYSRTTGPSARAREGIRRDSFKMPGLLYQRFRYANNEIVREIVRREGSTGSAVSTEVITWEGTHYRRSMVEGF